ncbi:MAG: SpoIIE family protein phosphatase [Chloroflexi bacterium]|nr:SpoIIE family protein phosphatase [Chloroflexota bacterium]
MTFLGALRVEATLDNLRTISYFLHGIGQRLELSEGMLFDIDLAVEEAAVNIVDYAYPPGDPGEMLVRAEVQDDAVHIALIDWGAPLDPDDVIPYDINAPVEVRIEGGMGLHLIHSLMDGAARQTSPEPGGPNTLTLIKQIERLDPSAHRPNTMRELNAMLAVSQTMMANVDLEDLLHLIINELVAAIDATGGTLYLIDEKAGELFSRILLEDTGELTEIRLKIGEGTAGHVAATGRVLNIQHAYDDPRFNRAFDQITSHQTRTILAAPMRNPQRKVIGVVQLVNKMGGPFTHRDERLLAAMAAQAAISIENTRLYAQEIQQQLINQELETAKTIQKSFLPDTVPQHAGWDIGAFWRPIREVAGDFYDFYTLPDGRLAVVIADVSGKGVPAALFMALTVTVLRFAMSLELTPGELLAHVNARLISDQKSKMFATVFVGYLDLESGTMQFASGGHNPPLLYRAATDRCEYLDASGVAVGVFKEANYAEETVTLADGDILVLYTDGITEVINTEEEEFGEERMEALIVQQSACPAQELAERNVEAAVTFAQDQGSFDDETLVVVKRVSTREKGVNCGRSAS